MLCLSVCLCICESAALSYNNSLNVGRLLLYIEVAGYDTCIAYEISREYVKGQGQGHRNCVKHIIVDNSGTTHRRIVKLVANYFDVMTNFLAS